MAWGGKKLSEDNLTLLTPSLKLPCARRTQSLKTTKSLLTTSICKTAALFSRGPWLWLRGFLEWALLIPPFVLCPKP